MLNKVEQKCILNDYQVHGQSDLIRFGDAFCCCFFFFESISVSHFMRRCRQSIQQKNFTQIIYTHCNTVTITNFISNYAHIVPIFYKFS